MRRATFWCTRRWRQTWACSGSTRAFMMKRFSPKIRGLPLRNKLGLSKRVLENRKRSCLTSSILPRTSAAQVGTQSRFRAISPSSNTAAHVGARLAAIGGRAWSPAKSRGSPDDRSIRFESFDSAFASSDGPAQGPKRASGETSRFGRFRATDIHRCFESTTYEIVTPDFLPDSIYLCHCRNNDISISEFPSQRKAKRRLGLLRLAVSRLRPAP